MQYILYIMQQKIIELINDMLCDNFTLNGSLKMYADLLNPHLSTRQAVYRLDLY